jgi:hypothetical protein
MTRRELDRLLEKTVAEAIGVPYRERPAKRAYKPRSPAAFQPVHPQHSMPELQRA